MATKYKTDEYKTWVRMRSRVRGSANEAAKRNYTNRGIVVCERWECFEAFLSDMGPRPRGAWLDRVNNDGPYAPDNCRWATPKEQQRNRRNNRVITFEGTSLCASAWAERLGMKKWTFLQRLRRGLSMAEIVNTASRSKEGI